MSREPISLRRRCGAALLVLPFVAGCGDTEANSTEVLYFSAIPDANLTELSQKYGKFADYLSEELDVTVEFKPTVKYAASVEAFRNGDIQLAWFGGVTGVQAREKVPGSRAIAQGKVDPEYVSYFIAHKDAGIAPSDSFPMAMEGKTFTFGSEDSTSGRVMPEFFIRDMTGKTPEEFFGSKPQFSGKHDLTALRVQEGTVQCGALSYKKYDSMVADGQIDPTVCVKVWTTPPYPDYNWTAHPDLEKSYGPGFIDKLQRALVELDDPELLEVLMRPEGLIEAQNSDFEAIANTMKQVGIGRD